MYDVQSSIQRCSAPGTQSERCLLKLWKALALNRVCCILIQKNKQFSLFYLNTNWDLRKLRFNNLSLAIVIVFWLVKMGIIHRSTLILDILWCFSVWLLSIRVAIIICIKLFYRLNTIPNYIKPNYFSKCLPRGKNNKWVGYLNYSMRDRK